MAWMCARFPPFVGEALSEEREEIARLTGGRAFDGGTPARQRLQGIRGYHDDLPSGYSVSLLYRYTTRNSSPVLPSVAALAMLCRIPWVPPRSHGWFRITADCTRGYLPLRPAWPL